MLIISETGELFFLGDGRQAYKLEVQGDSIVRHHLGTGFLYTEIGNRRLTYDGEEGRVSIPAREIIR
tara:strand:- start:33 stop:233 length:201 start_codon:yes stop_codon:yes gene_type:complete